MAKSEFINSIRQNLRMRGYSLRTEKVYLYWVKDYIRYHNLQHPVHLTSQDVVAYLSYLANARNVAINTQKSALNALAFLYNQFLNQPLGFKYAKKQRRLPIVLTPLEIQTILSHLTGRDNIIFSILYGSGLRITECLRLRIQDIDLNKNSLTVRDGKGGKDRKTILSPSLAPSLTNLMDAAIALQKQDNLNGVGPSLPHMLGKKYPGAYRQPAWMFLFPSTTICQHPITGITCRHHLHDSVPRKALKKSVLAGGLNHKKISCHTSDILLQHNFLKMEGTSVPCRNY